MRTFGFAAAGALLLVIVEITVFVLVANAIGWWWAVLAGVATTVLGGILAKREGVRAWQRLRAAVSEGRPPGGEAGTGVAGLAGALLLLAPGFVTDAAGLLLLDPAGAGVRRAAGPPGHRGADLRGRRRGPVRAADREGDPRRAGAGADAAALPGLPRLPGLAGAGR